MSSQARRTRRSLLDLWQAGTRGVSSMASICLAVPKSICQEAEPFQKRIRPGMWILPVERQGMYIEHSQPGFQNASCRIPQHKAISQHNYTRMIRGIVHAYGNRGSQSWCPSNLEVLWFRKPGQSAAGKGGKCWGQACFGTRRRLRIRQKFSNMLQSSCWIISK